MSLEVKADQLRMISSLKDYLRKVDLLDQGIQTNKIPSAYAAQALKTFFPHKPPHRLREIVVRAVPGCAAPCCGSACVARGAL